MRFIACIHGNYDGSGYTITFPDFPDLEVDEQRIDRVHDVSIKSIKKHVSTTGYIPNRPKTAGEILSPKDMLFAILLDDIEF